MCTYLCTATSQSLCDVTCVYRTYMQKMLLCSKLWDTFNLRFSNIVKRIKKIV